MTGAEHAPAMAVIEQHSNWGYWDRLDGKIIENGERLLVAWPDGPPTVVAVKVVRRGLFVDDHGHDRWCPDVRAYAAESIRGVEVLVPLVGLRAVRIGGGA